jgi:hypothetical protein
MALTVSKDSRGKAVKRGARIPSGVIITVGGLVRVDGDMLRWTWDFDRMKWSAPAKDLIVRFSLLWKKEPKDIIAFAEKWGPLHLDEYCLPVQGHVESEPLAAWWFLSKRVYAILEIAYALRRRSTGDKKYWEFLSKDFFYPKTSDSIERIEAVIGAKYAATGRRQRIAREVTSWLARFRIDLRLKWSPDASSWNLEISYGNRLINALALQLALVAANADSLFFCSGCKEPYIRHKARIPNKGEANYCETCAPPRARGRVQRGAAQRAAEARYRKKRRESREQR